MINTHVKLPGLDLKNPIMPASGTFGFGDVPRPRTGSRRQSPGPPPETGPRRRSPGPPGPAGVAGRRSTGSGSHQW